MRQLGRVRKEKREPISKFPLAQPTQLDTCAKENKTALRFGRRAITAQALLDLLKESKWTQ